MKLNRKILTCLVLALVCVALLVPSPFAARGAEGPAALFINVGKADCAVFFVDGKTFLVDTGTKGSAEAMLRALSAYSVTHLDGAMITHTDKDHVGGLTALLESDITVDKLYAPKLHSEKSDDKHPVFKASQKHNVPMNWLIVGETIPISEDSRFVVLGPLTRDLENENNNSLVLDLQTSHGNMLLAGDMEEAEEMALFQAGLVPPATVLKVAHHGGNDTSGLLFLATVKPQWAVISTSTEERESTPSPKVMQRLWGVGANVAVTQDASCGIYLSLWEGTATAEKIDYQ